MNIFSDYTLVFVVSIILQILLIIVPVLLSVAFLTLIERKVMAALQRRKGPDVVGFLGVLQPFADAVKLIVKETVIPAHANKFIFLLAPVITFLLSLVGWGVIPLGKDLVLSDINVGLIYLFAVSSLGVYGIVIAGWSSNSKYAFLGALRSAAQMVSYEVSIGLIIISVLVCVGSLNLTAIVEAQKYIWFGIPLWPVFLMFFVSSLAETNRPPFDLPEAEGELVAGYNVEYSAAGFTLFFIGEYANIILMSCLSVLLFMGGWLPPIDIVPFNWIPGIIWFSLKLNLILFGFVWVRAAFPRYRYDQLMHIGWKIFLPLSLGWVLLISGIVLVF